MHLGDLPFELQLKVVQLCSRRDWASLSRTHTSLRDAADYALYSHIPFRSLKFRQGFPFKAALQTLATNVHKASLVRVLDVQLTLYRSDLHFLEIMAEMLPNMFNLYKLRIAVSNHGIQEKFWRSGISGRINQAIRLVFIQAMITMTEHPSGLLQGGLFSTPASMPGGESMSLGGYQENRRQPADPPTPWIPPPQ